MSDTGNNYHGGPVGVAREPFRDEGSLFVSFLNMKEIAVDYKSEGTISLKRVVMIR